MPRNAMDEIEISIITEETGEPFLIDVLNFLYDFNLYYEISRLGTDERYGAYKLSPWVFTRRRRTLESNDRLHLQILSHESPTKLVAWITCTAAAITALGTLVRLPLVPMEREKLRLDIKLLNLEYEKRAKELGHFVEPTGSIEPHVDQRAQKPLGQTLKRIEKSPVRIEEVGVRLVPKEDDDEGKKNRGRK
jgi:hypothetical protein